jgi:hypothetical protein
MQIQDRDMSSDSNRTTIDRHAVTAAGQLLMSAIWLEHRVRRFSTRLSKLPSQRAPAMSFVSTSVADQTDRRMIAPGSRGDGTTPHNRKVRPSDCVLEGR